MPTLIKPKAAPAGRKQRTAGFWGIRYRCPHRARSWVISTLCTQKRAAESRLAEFVIMLERGQVGRDNPFLQRRAEQHRQYELSDLDSSLKAFESDLAAGRIRKRGKRSPVTASHVSLTMCRIRKIVSGIGATHLEEITTEAVNRFLDLARSDGTIKSQQTRKHWERAIKAFTRWCHQTKRTNTDGLADLEVTAVSDEDVVHSRSEFTLAEIGQIIAAASIGPVRSCLSGRERAMLYAFCATTGFRAREAASVRKRDFDQGFTFVTLAAAIAKNRKKARQPIPVELRGKLMEFTASLAPDDFLFPGGWQIVDDVWSPCGWVAGREAGVFLSQDAATVGIKCGREHRKANAGRVLDFHSLRHSFISGLTRAGVSDGLKQALARASAGIVSRYTHHNDADFASIKFPTPDLSNLGLVAVCQ